MQNISILAGNARIEKRENSFDIDPQLTAFEGAMRIASLRREAVAKIALAVDQKGDPNLLLDPSLSLSQKQRKRPKLAYLLPELREPYLELAAQHDVPLENIDVFMEKYLFAYIRTRSRDPRLYHFSHQACDEECRTVASDTSKARVNCQGVTAALIHKLSRSLSGKGGAIHTFWEQRLKWVDPIIITMGTKLAIEALGVRSDVIETMYRSTSEQQLISTYKEYLFDEETQKVEIY